MKAFLPPSPARSAIYGALSRARDRESLSLVRRMIEDVYGKPLPKPAENLLYLYELRLRAFEIGAKTVIVSRGRVRFVRD